MTIYEGLGYIPGEHRIEVDERVTPVITPCRKVAFKLKDKLKQELDRMEDQQVICKESGPTDWVNAITTPVKKNGDIRVCLDPRPLNKSIKKRTFSATNTRGYYVSVCRCKIFQQIRCFDRLLADEIG